MPDSYFNDLLEERKRMAALQRSNRRGWLGLGCFVLFAVLWPVLSGHYFVSRLFLLGPVLLLCIILFGAGLYDDTVRKQRSSWLNVIQMAVGIATFIVYVQILMFGLAFG